MINVIITPDYFEVSGHSQYAEPGKDIVCSAVSALAQTFALGLSEHIGASVDADFDGYIRVDYDDFMNDDEVVDILLETFKMGLKEIEEEYPNYLKIKEDV